MTWQELSELVEMATFSIPFQQQHPVDLIALLQLAENEFIRLSDCTFKHTVIDTSTVNEGVLQEAYTLPSDFLREFRIEINGQYLETEHIQSRYSLHDSSAQVRTGSTPGLYRIEGMTIRLIPALSAHAKIIIWHSYLDVNPGTSPIILTDEQMLLQDWVIAKLYETDGNIKMAQYYLTKFEANAVQTASKHNLRRNKQTRIADATNADSDNVKRNLSFLTQREGVDGWAPTS
jgi:hypothetical protein